MAVVPLFLLSTNTYANATSSEADKMENIASCSDAMDTSDDENNEEDIVTNTNYEEEPEDDVASPSEVDIEENIDNENESIEEVGVASSSEVYENYELDASMIETGALFGATSEVARVIDTTAGTQMGYPTLLEAFNAVANDTSGHTDFTIELINNVTVASSSTTTDQISGKSLNFYFNDYNINMTSGGADYKIDISNTDLTIIAGAGSVNEALIISDVNVETLRSGGTMTTPATSTLRINSGIFEGVKVYALNDVTVEYAYVSDVLSISYCDDGKIKSSFFGSSTDIHVPCVLTKNVNPILVTNCNIISGGTANFGSVLIQDSDCVIDGGSYETMDNPLIVIMFTGTAGCGTGDLTIKSGMFISTKDIFKTGGISAFNYHIEGGYFNTGTGGKVFTTFGGTAGTAVLKGGYFNRDINADETAFYTLASGYAIGKYDATYWSVVPAWGTVPWQLNADRTELSLIGGAGLVTDVGVAAGATDCTGAGTLYKALIDGGLTNAQIQSIKKVSFVENKASGDNVVFGGARSCLGLFWNNTCLPGGERPWRDLKEVDFVGADLTNIESMEKMFIDCTNLKKVTFGNSINSVNNESLKNMFTGCTSLTTVDFGNSFNTQSVNDAKEMFKGCTSLSSINANFIDTSSLADVMSMFDNCTSLKNVDLSSFDASSIMEATYMFYKCSSLSSIDLSNWETYSLAFCTSMFNGCTSLKSVDLSQFDLSNAISVNACKDMFSNAPLETLVLGPDALGTIDVTKLSLYDIGWKGSDDSILTYASTNDMLNAHQTKGILVTYTKHPPVYYQVSFDTDGGTSVSSQSIHSGSKATKPSNPTKSGYTFVNWYKENSYTNVFDFNTVITNDITLYAKWDSNGTTGGGGSSSSGGSSGGGSGVSSGSLFNSLDVGIKSDTKTNDWFRNAKGNWYYIDSTRNPYRGWFKDPRDQQWYYLDRNTGIMAQGWTEVDGKEYYFSPQEESPNWYYSKDTDRWYCHGEVTKSRGAMYSNEMTPDGIYVNDDGNVVNLSINEREIKKVRDADKNSWYRTKSGQWYYLDKNKEPFKGWLYDINDNQWYYLDTQNGVMATGWRKIDGKYYYFSEQEISNNWQYDEKLSEWICNKGIVKSKGSMYRNEQTPDGHAVDASGEIVENQV